MAQGKFEMLQGSLFELQFQRRFLLDQFRNRVVSLHLGKGIFGGCAVLNGLSQLLLGMGKIGSVAVEFALQCGDRGLCKLGIYCPDKLCEHSMGLRLGNADSRILHRHLHIRFIGNARKPHRHRAIFHVVFDCVV